MNAQGISALTIFFNIDKKAVCSLHGEIIHIELEFMKYLILNPNKFPNVKLFSKDYQETPRLLNVSDFSEIKY